MHEPLLYYMRWNVSLALFETRHHARPHKDRAMHCCRAIHINIFQFVKIRFPGCYVFIDKFICSALQREPVAGIRVSLIINISAIPGA